MCLCHLQLNMAALFLRRKLVKFVRTKNVAETMGETGFIFEKVLKYFCPMHNNTTLIACMVFDIKIYRLFHYLQKKKFMFYIVTMA